MLRPWPVVFDGTKKTEAYMPEEWAEKVYEEVDEALEACATESAQRAVEEIIDVVTVCTSWLHALGVDTESLNEMVRYVNLKNRERGYTETAKGR